VRAESLEPLFEEFFKPLQRGKHLEGYRVLRDYHVISVDGSGILVLIRFTVAVV